MNCAKRTFLLLVLAGAPALVHASQQDAARTPARLSAIDSEADRMLRQMTGSPAELRTFSHPYDIILVERAKTSMIIGRETVEGVRPKPVPLRLVITTKTTKEQPQSAVQLSNWKTQANFPTARRAHR
jgi:hypothetical protein